MREKMNFRKRLCCSVAAIMSLVMCGGNLYAANNALPETAAGTTAPGIALAPADELTGTWIIDQVKIKKTVNGISSENTYSRNQRFESFADCPNKITFTADGKVRFEYAGKDPQEDSYTVESDRITRMTPAAWFEYEYTLTDANKIQLVYSVDYVRYPNDVRNEITEEYTFFGTKE